MELILLYVIGSLDVGGAERHLSQLLPRLKARGFHPCVFTLTEKGQLAPGLEAQGIPVLTAPKLAFAPLLPNSMRRLVRALLGAIGLISYLAATTGGGPLFPARSLPGRRLVHLALEAKPPADESPELERLSAQVPSRIDWNAGCIAACKQSAGIHGPCSKSRAECGRP